MEQKGYLHQIRQIHPVLPVKDVVEALDFYVNRSGFKIAFADNGKNPKYAGILRHAVEIHLQWPVNKLMAHEKSENLGCVFLPC